MLDIPLVIWVNSPPHVERGAFAYLEDHWSAGVVYAVLGELRAERKAMGWGEDAGMSRAVLRARGSNPVGKFCDEMLRDYPQAYHLVAGLSNVTGRALTRIVRSSPPERIAVFTERPGVFGPLPRRVARRIFQPVKYRWLVRRFRRHVGLLLPLGQVGIERFVRYGWPRENTAPFMYCPELKRESMRSDNQGRTVKFLYVGRLSRYAKGTDILMKATGLLHGNWRLTIVGGHGDLVDVVKDWSTKSSNVDFVGAASPEQVAELLAGHDVCIVPSRVDGWNVIVNEALNMGRGAIVTGSVGSDELIYASRAGVVVGAGSARQLGAAMQRVIDDPSLAVTWSDRAVEYAPLISPEAVGRYLFELLQSAVERSTERRRGAPWLRGPHFEDPGAKE